jgi:hypothetical protein
MGFRCALCSDTPKSEIAGQIPLVYDDYVWVLSLWYFDKGLGRCNPLAFMKATS